jgi:hypothetical protein
LFYSKNGTLLILTPAAATAAAAAPTAATAPAAAAPTSIPKVAASAAKPSHIFSSSLFDIYIINLNSCCVIGEGEHFRIR